MKIAFVLYPGFTALDLVGPYDVISRWPDADVHFLAATLDPVRTDRGGFRDNLRALGIDVVEDRVVFDGTHVSGAGVAAGIDMALALTERVHGRELAESLQLVIEYDPQPPFDSGSPEKASASTLRLALKVLLGDRPFRNAAALNAQAVRARLGRARRRVA